MPTYQIAKGFVWCGTFQDFAKMCIQGSQISESSDTTATTEAGIGKRNQWQFVSCDLELGPM